MDYLDPQKQRRHGILLITGYICIAVAIVIATIVLVYQAYGFGIDKNGAVIQNGIVFISSQPSPAKIYIDGKLANSNTNARLSLPANLYDIRLARDGYQDWQRKIEVDGGSVSHFDYPLLLPKIVKTTTVTPLTALPSFSTQSPDRRWILLSTATDNASFQVADLKNPTKQLLTISLPANLVTKATTSERWQLGEWADDNQHVLLKRLVDDKTEYILLDRQNPELSLNLNQTLPTASTNLSLRDKKYDQYYVFNEAEHSLQTASLRTPTLAPYLTNVLAYKSYGNNQVLYFTSTEAPTGKALLKLQDGTRTTTLRSFPASAHYLVDLASYDGTPYVVASSADENKVYIYKDPIAQLASRTVKVIVPLQVLRVTAPDYESFSSTAQYVMAEHGGQVAVYDLQNKTGYNYSLKAPLDAVQSHITWMDGNRLTYISGSVLQILDYDQQNQRAFVANNPATQPFFAPDYKNLYTLISTPNGANLTATSLLTP
jgi:hypothetical protein